MELNTRNRVLESACNLFSRDGYRSTTIARICREASANVAAVNYYFGSKENLYLAAWEYAEEKADETYGPVSTGNDPEEYLRAIISRIIRMIFDPGPGGWLPRMIRKAMEQRGELLDQILQKYLAPRRQLLQATVASLIGCPPGDREAVLATGYVHSMCVYFNFHPHHRQHVFGEQPPSSLEVAEIVASVQDFALGGIERARGHFVSTDSNSKPNKGDQDASR